MPDLPDRTPGALARTSAGLPLSQDAYHGSYNDYLWQLALADGEAIAGTGPAEPADSHGSETGQEPKPGALPS